jgi:hypothetical protein
MKPLAIFYHCIVEGGATGVSPVHSIPIIAEQMQALKESGLHDAATEFHVGLNGDEAASVLLMMLAGEKARITIHGKSARSEIPTLALLQRWLPGHPGWYVLYFHPKGVTALGQKLREDWRRCMMRAVVWGWRQCISELDKGADAAGCHWLTPERFGSCVKTPYFGGTFWWAKSDFLMTLPPLPTPTWENRYEAESWIGRRPRRPVVVDYHPEWPGGGCHG